MKIRPPASAPTSDDNGPERPRRLSSDDEVSRAVRHMLRRTDTGPMQVMAVRGLALALEELMAWVPQIAALHDSVRISADRLAAQHNNGQDGLDVLSSKARTRVYEAAIHLAHARQRGWEPDKLVAALLAAWTVHGLITDEWPSDERVARANNVFRVPDSRTSLLWTPEQRTSALLRAIRALQAVLGENGALAADYGLASALAGPPRPKPTGIEGFNRLLLARRAALYRYSSKKDRGAGGGHGTLSLGEIRRLGDGMFAESQLALPRAAYGYLQGLSELTAQLVKLLPVQLGDTPPPGALAWLDLRQACYCASLVKVTAKGALPHAGTEGLYLPTDQVVRRPLLPAVAQIINKAAAAHGEAWVAEGWCELRKLLGDCAYQPGDEIGEGSVPGATVRRLQRSLTVHLIDAGYARWPVALTLHNSQIITGAREYYAACRTEGLNNVHAAVHAVLNWPAPPTLPGAGLVGAYVSIAPQSITKLVHSFATAADRAFDRTDVAGIVRRINRHAEWLLVMMALSLALRDWGTYALSPRELAQSHEVVFCEKSVHDVGEAPTPVIEPLRRAALAWLVLLDSCIARLHEIKGADALALAKALRGERERTDGGDRVFTVGADLRLHLAGTRTWTQRLPPSLRVVNNFGRHFWPLVLGDAGLPQLLIDVLLRQQLLGLHAGTEARGGTRSADYDSLRFQMELVISGLELTAPRAMSGGVL